MRSALLADGPAVLPVVALVPPAIQNAAIRQPVHRGLLAAGAAGFVGSDWIVQPHICTRNEITGHIDIVVLQKDHLATKGIAAREAIDLLNQVFARLIGWMRLASEDNLQRVLRIAHNLFQPWRSETHT